MHRRQVCILSKQDFYRVAQQGCDNVGVYAPVAEGYARLKSNTDTLLDAGETANQNLAVAKLYLGYSRFSDEERRLLRQWREGLGPDSLQALNKWAAASGFNLARL